MNPVDRFLQVSLPEFKELFKNNTFLGYILIQLAYDGNKLREELSSEQKNNIKNIEDYISVKAGVLLDHSDPNYHKKVKDFLRNDRFFYSVFQKKIL